jgi:hypothetical protein
VGAPGGAALTLGRRTLTLGRRTLTHADTARPADLLSGIACAAGGPIDIYGRVIAAQKIGA